MTANPADAVREALDDLAELANAYDYEGSPLSIVRNHIAALTARVAELEARCRPVPLSSVEVIVGERGDTVLTVSTTADEIRQFHRLAALAGAAPDQWFGEVECSDAKGAWLVLCDVEQDSPIKRGAKVVVTLAGRPHAPAKAREDALRALLLADDSDGPEWNAAIRAALATLAEGKIK